MGDFRLTAPVRANLSAGRLKSFGFAVQAAIGFRPLRCLIGRLLTDTTAITGLFVTQPQNLAGTHVWITEDQASRECDVVTHVPTMKRSVRLAERYCFDCLPLTDIGYLDLMAWRYPGLERTAEDIDVDMSWSRWRSAERYRYRGPASAPGLTVTEAIDPTTGMLVARTVDRLGEPFRRWEVVAMGPPDLDLLPERIRVSRRATGSWTEFRRTGEPVSVSEQAFQAGPARLQEALEQAFSGPGM